MSTPSASTPTTGGSDLIDLYGPLDAVQFATGPRHTVRTSTSATRIGGGFATYKGLRTKSRLLLNVGPPNAVRPSTPMKPAPRAQATGRHRRERSCPVGKSRMIATRPMTKKIWATLEIHAAAPVASNRPERPRVEYVAYSPEASCTLPTRPRARRIFPIRSLGF